MKQCGYPDWCISKCSSDVLSSICDITGTTPWLIYLTTTDFFLRMFPLVAASVQLIRYFLLSVGSGQCHSLRNILKSAEKKIWATSWQNQQNSLCAQWRLRSAKASAQSDQSLRCPYEETLVPQLPTECTAKTDQTGRIPRLICVFAGGTDHFVGFFLKRLIMLIMDRFATFVCSVYDEISNHTFFIFSPDC